VLKKCTYRCDNCVLKRVGDKFLYINTYYTSSILTHSHYINDDDYDNKNIDESLLMTLEQVVSKYKIK
jgi:hypothetical protein